MPRESYPYIGDGFYMLTTEQAIAWCHKLPRDGYEKIIKNNSGTYIVAKTKHNGKMVWSIRARHI